MKHYSCSNKMTKENIIPLKKFSLIPTEVNDCFTDFNGN